MMPGVRKLQRFVRWLPMRLAYGRGPLLMSALRKRWILAKHPHADIRFGEHVFLGPGFNLHIAGPGAFHVGDRVEFRRNFRAEINGSGRIEIGDDCRFTYDVLVQCTTSITIEPRSIVAQSSLLVDGSHRFRDPDTPMLEQGYDYRPLRLGPDAAVMSKCTVLADVGEKAFVGANSVVAKAIPPYTLAIGTPARPVEYFGPPGGEPPELGQ